MEEEGGGPPNLARTQRRQNTGGSYQGGTAKVQQDSTHPRSQFTVPQPRLTASATASAWAAPRQRPGWPRTSPESTLDPPESTQRIPQGMPQRNTQRIPAARSGRGPPNPSGDKVQPKFWTLFMQEVHVGPPQPFWAPRLRLHVSPPRASLKQRVAIRLVVGGHVVKSTDSKQEHGRRRL